MRVLFATIAGVAMGLGGLASCGSDPDPGGVPSDVEGGTGGTGGVSAGGNGGGGAGGSGGGSNSVAPLVTKVDLLLAIQNSQAMSDKQGFLAQAIPEFIGRLVRPDCVQRDGSGNVTARMAASGALPDLIDRQTGDLKCPAGWSQ